MANFRLLADCMPNYHRSLGRVFSKNPSTIFISLGGGGLPSSIQSSALLLPRFRVLPFVGSVSTGFGKSATFSPTPRNFSTLQVAAVPPIRSSSPSLMVHPDIDDPKLIAESELKLKLEANERNNCYCRFSLADNKVVKINKDNLRLQWQRETLLPANKDAICVGSSHGWLAFINRTNCALYLFNPFNNTNATPIDDSFSLPFFSLPPIETLPSVISSFRRGKSTTTEYTCDSRVSPVSSKEMSDGFVKKLVLSSAPFEDCTVMAIQGYGHSSELAFCRPGDTAWTPLNGPLRCYTELMYYSKDQQFYALSVGGSMEAWDLRNPASPNRTLVKNALPPTVYHTMDEDQRQSRIDSKASPGKYYLVESSGDLLMVIRYVSFIVDDNGDIIRRDVGSPLRRTVLFDVYKLDFVHNKWVYVPNLGDCVLFVGLNHSASLSARDFPELRENSIYFSPFTKSMWGNTIGGHELGVFNLEDNTITPFYGCNFKRIQSTVWIIPQF